MKTPLEFAARCLALCLTTVATAQSTWYVDTAGTAPGTGTQADPYTSIQFAIDSATTLDGDTILVAAGAYEPFSLGPPSVDRAMSIEASAGAAATTVNGGASVTLSAVVSGFTFTDRVDLGGTLNDSVVRGGLGVIFDAGVFEEAFANRCTVTNTELGFTNFAFYNGMAIADCISYANTKDLGTTGLISVQNTFTTADGLDPQFWDESGGDLHLRFGSPAIQYSGGTVDVGAFPFDPLYLPTPTVYCTSKITSDGCTPLVSSAGSSAASFSATESFLVTATNVSENKPGLFYYGLGPSTFPLSGSWFCVTPPTLRTAIQASGSLGSPCSGQFEFDFNAYLQSGQVLPFLAPGMGVYGQFWFRDPGDPSMSARTEAIGFALLP